MIANFDYFNNPVDPKLFICNPDKTILAPITRYTDSSGRISLKVNACYDKTSDLSVDVYKYVGGVSNRNPDSNISIADCYQYIDVYRQIHVENLGYFVITSCTECNDGLDPYYEVTAQSCEIELNTSSLDLAAGTYQFWDAFQPTNTILGKILALCPDWSIGSISTVVANRNRTFDDFKQNVYNFMVNDMANAYECIVAFDIETRQINIIDISTEIPNTDILLTYDNVLKYVKVTKDGENIITAIDVTGGNDLDIRDVNPIGGNVIYDLTYFKNISWMSQDLIDAIDAWEGLIVSNTSAFNSLVLQINTAQGEYATLDGQLSDLNSQLLSLNQQLGGAAALNNGTYASIKSQVDSKQVQVNAKQSEVNAKLAQINTLAAQLSTLQNTLSLESNFSSDQLKSLKRFINVRDFKDENIVITPSMTYAQKQAQAQTLYNKGKLLLDERSQATLTLDVSCENFVLIPDFDKFRSQMTLGKMIHAEIYRGTIIDTMLLEYDIDYDSKSLTIKVSNRLKLFDSYRDSLSLQNQISSSASTINWQRDIWSLPVKSGSIDAFNTFRTSSLDLTKNAIIQTNGQIPVLDPSGIHGFKQNTDGTYSPEQLWITNNCIAFTTDNWSTIKSAFGKLQLPNGTWVYGLNADAILAGTIDAGVVNVTNINATNITTGSFNANLITTGKIQSADGKVYFDLTNSVLCASQLIDSGDSTIIVDVGYTNTPFGNGRGVVFQKTNGDFCKFLSTANVATNTFTSKSGAVITSDGDINLDSNWESTSLAGNIFHMYRETSGAGAIFLGRTLGSTYTDVLTCSANQTILTFATNSSTHSSYMDLRPNEVRLGTGNTYGFSLTPSAGYLYGTWYINSVVITSDRNLKDNIQSVNNISALDRIKGLNFYSYNIKVQDPSVRMATITGYEGTEQISKIEGISSPEIVQAAPPLIPSPHKTGIGLMYDEVPDEIKADVGDNKGIDTYALASLDAKGIQELYIKFEELSTRLAVIESMSKETTI